ncbi:MAG: hypothetical protein RIB59_14905 [Rhodospirillales bacterium]
MPIKYSKLKTSVAVLGIATLAGVGAANALPLASVKADSGIQLAACGACNPCKAKRKCGACNPCKAKSKCGACNPCKATKKCNPCNPCKAKRK